MDDERVKEEYLEVLWHMKEDNDASLARFREELREEFRPELLGQLGEAGIVEVEGGRIQLTASGREHTRKLIRSHRLAERLVHDVLGVEYEKGACEFEHILNPDLVDSICTLLGHPRECPHGMPIPEGECCRQGRQAVESSVVALSELRVGEQARVAYVYASSDQQLHRLDNLLLRPGARVKLHQRSPSFVLECEGSLVAVDDRVASSIHVWVKPHPPRKTVPHGRRGARRGLRHGPGFRT
jgi:DtxR family Mn-dependent transcriptional regulator